MEAKSMLNCGAGRDFYDSATENRVHRRGYLTNSVSRGYCLHYSAACELGRARGPSPHEPCLVVVFQSEMRDQLFALQVPQSVFQLHQLDEQIVLRIQSRRGHRRLEVEAQPLLNAQATQLGRALRKVEE